MIRAATTGCFLYKFFSTFSQYISFTLSKKKRSNCSNVIYQFFVRIKINFFKIVLPLFCYALFYASYFIFQVVWSSIYQTKSYHVWNLRNVKMPFGINRCTMVDIIHCPKITWIFFRS